MYDVLEAARLNLRDYYFYIRAVTNYRAKGMLYLCNSFPKSGTHLLSQIIMKSEAVKYWDDIISVQSLSGYMNNINHIRWKYGSVPSGSLVRSHLMHDNAILEILDAREHRRFFIYRDPRDIVCSHANWVLKEPAIFLHKIYKHTLTSQEERISASIAGIPLGTPLGSNKTTSNISMDFARWKGWLTDQNTLCVKFEDLVGKRGGGCEETRFSRIKQILEWMGMSPDTDKIRALYGSESMDPTESNTYKRGQKGAIGGWREKFTEAHKTLFKKYAGDLLIELGYENSFDW